MPNSFKIIRKIGSILPELKEIDIIKKITSNLIAQPCILTFQLPSSSFGRSCFEELDKYIEKLSIFSNEQCSIWNNTYNHQTECFNFSTTNLNSALVNVDMLLAIEASPALSQQARKITTEIAGICDSFSKQINSEMSSFSRDKKGKRKATYIASMEVCAVFFQIAKLIPCNKEVQLKKRDLVGNQTCSTEEKIQALSNWEHTNKHIEMFKSAKVLNCVSCNKVSFCLQTTQAERTPSQQLASGHD